MSGTGKVPFTSAQLAAAIVEWIDMLASNPDENPDIVDIASLDVAAQCLQSAFGLDIEPSNPHLNASPFAGHKLTELVTKGLESYSKQQDARNQPVSASASASTKPNDDSQFQWERYLKSLEKKGLFDGAAPGTQEYAERLERARVKFNERFGCNIPSQMPVQPQPAHQETSAKPIDQATKARAQQFKEKGNQFLAESRLDDAIWAYTSAIELDPFNAILYSNRAAAYLQQGKYESAIVDCNKALEIDPQFAKAHSRLGTAYFSLGRYEDARTEYAAAAAIDPSSPTYKENLERAEQKLEQQRPPAGTHPTPQAQAAAPGGGMPFDMNAFGQMFQNPAVMQMVSQMAMQMGQSGGIGGMMGNVGSRAYAGSEQTQRPQTQGDSGQEQQPTESTPIVEEPDEQQQQAAPEPPQADGQQPLPPNPFANIMQMAESMAQNPAMRQMAENLAAQMGVPLSDEEGEQDQGQDGNQPPGCGTQ